MKKLLLTLPIFSIIGISFVFGQNKIEIEENSLNSIDIVESPSISEIDELKEDEKSQEIIDLEALVDKYLNKTSYGYDRYNTQLNYNEIIEKQIKLLLLKIFDSNKKYVLDNFLNNSRDRGGESTRDKILNIVPKSFNKFSISDLFVENGFGIGIFLDKSFGIDFVEDDNNSLLVALKQIIENYKRRNGAYPTSYELGKQTIIRNGKRHQISTIMDEIDYKLKFLGPKNKITEEEEIELLNKINKYIGSGTNNIKDMEIQFIKEGIQLEDLEEKLGFYLSVQSYPKYKFPDDLKQLISDYLIKKYGITNVSYELKLKDVFYSLEEAEILNMEIELNKFIDNSKGLGPTLNQQKIALDLYFQDNGSYPEELEDLIPEYINSVDSVHFSYEITDNGKKYSISYDEKYKAELQEQLEKERKGKDYSELIANVELEEIPEIYKKIPNDSLFFHIKNPQVFFKILDQDEDKLGFATLRTITKLKTLVIDWLGIENFDELKNGLQNEIVVIASDLDLITPNLVIVLDEKDIDVIKPTNLSVFSTKKDGKIYIATSKNMIDNLFDLDEKDSIYNSDEFKYSWSKQGSKFKDMFFFAGDKFFENMIRLENYLKMYRKINDYYNLKNLQYYVWAYQKQYGKKLNKFDELETILGLSEGFYDNFEIKNSIVSHNKIGKIGDIKNISDIDYDLDTITSIELKSFQKSVLGYREIRRANLDPVSIVLNYNDEGYDLDFMMTPIPELTSFNDFEIIFELLKGNGIQDYELLSNKKLKLGAAGILLGFDFQKFVDKLDGKEDRDMIEFKEAIEGFNDYVLGGSEINDYLGNEFGFFVSNIDTRVFKGYDFENMDLGFIVEFKSNLRAEEFVKLLFKFVAGEVSRGSFRSMKGGLMDVYKEGIIKPIMEDYKGHDINQIPIGQIRYAPSFNIYYTILEKYLYVSVSQNTIKSVIDYYEGGAFMDKNKILSRDMMDSEKVLITYFDSIAAQTSLDSMLSGSKDLYLAFKQFSDSSGLGLIKSTLGKFYSQAELASIKGEDIDDIDFNYGFVQIKNKEDKLFLLINKDLITLTDSDILEDMNGEFESIDSKFFEGDGGDLLELYEDKSKFKYLINMSNFQLISDIGFLKSLIRSLYYALNVDDEEIQMQLSIFKEEGEYKVPNEQIEGEDEVKDEDNDVSKTKDSSKFESKDKMYYMIGIGVLLLVIIFLFILLIKKKK